MHAELKDVQMVWQRAAHNAFPDLLRHGGRYICVLREASAHISSDGAIRVLSSEDGVVWQSISLIAVEGYDLRDPRISETPEGGLMVICGAVNCTSGERSSFISQTWFSSDGVVWDGPCDVGDPGIWLWRATWYEGSAYAFGYYGVKDDYHITLYRSNDGGHHFDKWVDHAFCDGYCNEHGMVFSDEGEAVMLLRCDPEPAVLGRAKVPFQDWEWQRLDKRIGGPQLIRWRGELLAGVRLYEPEPATWICRINEDDGRVEPLLQLPSSGDTSYPGLCLEGDLLRMIYYSEHTGKCMIWSALIELQN